ncbi:hypothetical protein BGX29_006098 [Mortierella sp. GBA35]|nr:hypothetical protein BGX23_001186 [Mortierella sp. AD031]KAF9100992.1 hypothetical protein BGX29_006098 [Mortierella sp. GBA35]
MSLKKLLNWLLCRPCLFCEIVQGNTLDRVIYQDDDIVAFYDIRPAAETHILIIPAVHIDSVKTVQVTDYQLLLKIKAKALDLLKQHGHEPENCRLGFHIPPFNTVDHLHLHVLGGEFKSALRSAKYETGKKWYMDLSKLFADLEQKM